MKAKKIMLYKFDGKTFNSPKEVQEYCVDKIGAEVLDPINRRAPLQKHSDLFVLMEILTSKDVRECLKEYLFAKIETEDENGEEFEENVFDNMPFKAKS